VKVVVALDQGTTSSRAIAFDQDSNIVAIAQEELPQCYPRPGWVEHEPEQVWGTQYKVAKRVIDQVGASNVAAIGITNQRETTVLWDRGSGKAVHPAIVWQDRRTADHCERLKADGYEELIASKTGLVIDSYFSATKLAWLLERFSGDLAFGTVDSFLVWRLTGGKKHVTDSSNASRTMLFNIRELAWDEELLGLFDIPPRLLPDVVPSGGLVGETDPKFFGRAIPIFSLIGDQQSATFGQCCHTPGMAKSTYGTGCFLLMNTGKEAIRSRNRLLTTVAWQATSPVYALEGSVFVAGAAVQWLRDGLGMISSADETEALALAADSTEGVYLIPAFTGLGAPYWDSHARGTIVGLTRGSDRRHLVRAALEAIAYQCRDVLEAMALDCCPPVTELRVDGGAARNNFLMQFQADILGVPVSRPRITETTALGAAYLAGTSCGFWRAEDLPETWKLERRFEPQMSEEKRSQLYGGWKAAVERAITP
jgi:glycerol kinase